MKRIITLLGASCLILASCSSADKSSTEEISAPKAPEESASSVIETTTKQSETTETPSVTETTTKQTETTEMSSLSDPEKTTAGDVPEAPPEESPDLDTTGLMLDTSRYSSKAKLLRSGDIRLESFECGYISVVEPYRLIIENKAQFDAALEKYHLAMPEGEPEDHGEKLAAAKFQDVVSACPIDDYSYAVEYVSVGNSGYDLHAGALIADTDKLDFVYTADSLFPEPDRNYDCVMGGWCFIAAVPKGTFMSDRYEGWTYPES